MEVIRKNTENNFSESSGKVVANRGELFAKYNELKSDFIIDHEPEAATLPELLNNNLDNEDQKSDDSVKTEEKIIEEICWRSDNYNYPEEWRDYANQALKKLNA